MRYHLLGEHVSLRELLILHVRACHSVAAIDSLEHALTPISATKREPKTSQITRRVCAGTAP